MSRSSAAPPQLVIFDCDGVLIDSEVLACRNVAECFSAFGFPITEEEVAARFLGKSGASMLAELEAQFGRPMPPEALEMRRERIVSLYQEQLRPMPGLSRLLDRLEVPVCVASSGTPEYLDFSLRLVDLHARFAPHIFSAAMVARGKPAPDLFLFAAERMGVAPAACLVIEDSAAGVQAATAAGMTVLGFTGGSHCRDQHADGLQAAGAHTLFCDFADPPPLLAAAFDAPLAASAPARQASAGRAAAPAQPG